MLKIKNKFVSNTRPLVKRAYNQTLVQEVPRPLQSSDNWLNVRRTGTEKGLPAILLFKKSILLGIILICTLGIGQERVYATKQPIDLKNSIQIALKENLDVRIAKIQRKGLLLQHGISNFSRCFPSATVSIAQRKAWQKQDSTTTLQAVPIVDVAWKLSAIVDKLFDTQLSHRRNSMNALHTNHIIEKVVKEVVTGYYKLALVQKKCEMSNTILKVATADLKKAEARLKLGLIAKIDYLEAALSLKKLKLTLLEQQEDLKEKSRVFNLLLNQAPNSPVVVVSNFSIESIDTITNETPLKVVDFDLDLQKKQVELASIKLNQSKCKFLAGFGFSFQLCSDGSIYDFKDKAWIRQPAQSLSLGLTFSLDLGELLLLPAQVKLAKMELNAAKFKLFKQQATSEGALEHKKWMYQHAISMYKIALEQFKVCKQKLDLVKERYRLNQIELLKLQKAQETVQKAELALIENVIKVKELEFECYELTTFFV